MSSSAYNTIELALAGNDVKQLYRAKDTCRAILKHDSKNPTFLFLMGRIEFQLGHLELASKWIKKVLTIKSESPELHCIPAAQASRNCRLMTLPLALRGSGSASGPSSREPCSPTAAQRTRRVACARRRAVTGHDHGMHPLTQHWTRLCDDGASITAGWLARTDSTSAE